MCYFYSNISREFYIYTADGEVNLSISTPWKHIAGIEV